MMIDAITILYLTVPVISAFSYVPQIYRLMKDPKLGIGLSLSSWIAWSVMLIITVAYASIVVKDTPFIIASVFGLTGCLAVTYFALDARISNKS